MSQIDLGVERTQPDYPCPAGPDSGVKKGKKVIDYPSLRLEGKELIDKFSELVGDFKVGDELCLEEVHVVVVEMRMSSDEKNTYGNSVQLDVKSFAGVAEDADAADATDADEEMPLSKKEKSSKPAKKLSDETENEDGAEQA